MAVDVVCEMEIASERARVAEFMFDPSNDARWTQGVIESRALTPGRLATGSRVERRSRFLGRSFSYLVEVVEHDGDALVAMRVTTPFPMQIRYELEARGSTTLARIRAAGEPGGFFKLAGPLLGRMVRRNIQQDLERLRDCVEGG